MVPGQVRPSVGTVVNNTITAVHGASNHEAAGRAGYTSQAPEPIASCATQMPDHRAANLTLT